MHDFFSQSFDSCPKPKMQIDGLVLSARKGRFVEKIASSIRRTGGVVQRKKPKRQAVGHAGLPPCPGWRPRESIRLPITRRARERKGLGRYHQMALLHSFPSPLPSCASECSVLARQATLVFPGALLVQGEGYRSGAGEEERVEGSAQEAS